ncbi:MAG: hypothetical protein PPP58_05225 [Natronomonas sp.]
MSLDRGRVESLAAEYAETEPLYAVEADHVETLPKAFASGEYGRRDAEWVVQWYYRRFLGSYPDDDRQAVEDAFESNDFDAIRTAITAATNADDAASAIDRLTDLDGVDVPVASAFLFYIDPTAYIVVGRREWAALVDAGRLTEPYPDPPRRSDYSRYLEVCLSVSADVECDLWTLYRALWRCASE